MNILLSSACTSGIILFLISASSAMSFVMAYTGIPAAISSGISKISIEEVAKTLLPYFKVLFIILLAVTYIPVLSVGLPSLMGLI